jgi:4-amino-4-deoxy-L-arabinose transferase-like glycosyltransferase
VPRTARGRWFAWLTLISIASLVPPVAWILTHDLHAAPTGDAFYFQVQASLIANGSGWFISPFPYLLHHAVVQSAQHPPLWLLVLAFADTLGLNSFLSHLFFACVLGAVAVFVTGLAGREVAGPRVGLIAAAIAAVYPNYWINDTNGLSETFVLLLVSAVVFASYRFWHRPTTLRAVGLGALCALTGLTRSEQTLLVVAVLVPIALVLRNVTLRQRLRYAGVGALTALLMIAPWIGFNLSRFSQPVVMSDDLGGTLAFANCRPAFYGRNIGFGDFKCLAAAQRGATGDESAVDAHNRRVALHYINIHSTRLPFVMAIRVGREFGFYRPLAQVGLDVKLSSRPRIPDEIALYMYYALLAGAVFGGITIRRRGKTVVPFVGLLVEVVVATVVTFGATRYRAPLEVGLVVLGAVSIDVLVERWSGRGGSVAPEGSTVGSSGEAEQRPAPTSWWRPRSSDPVPARRSGYDTTAPSRSLIRRPARPATSGSWVATTIVTASSPDCNSVRSDMRSLALDESRFPVGSSAMITLGRFARARAMATRCCSPPDRRDGRWSIRPPSPTRSSSSAARSLRWDLLWPWGIMAMPTFSSAVRVGTRLNCWKTKPIS